MATQTKCQFQIFTGPHLVAVWPWKEVTYLLWASVASSEKWKWSLDPPHRVIIGSQGDSGSKGLSWHSSWQREHAQPMSLISINIRKGEQGSHCLQYRAFHEHYFDSCVFCMFSISSIWVSGCILMSWYSCVQWKSKIHLVMNGRHISAPL